MLITLPLFLTLLTYATPSSSRTIFLSSANNHPPNPPPPTDTLNFPETPFLLINSATGLPLRYSYTHTSNPPLPNKPTSHLSMPLTFDNSTTDTLFIGIFAPSTYNHASIREYASMRHLFLTPEDSEGRRQMMVGEGVEDTQFLVSTISGDSADEDAKVNALEWGWNKGQWEEKEGDSKRGVYWVDGKEADSEEDGKEADSQDGEKWLLLLDTVMF